MARHSFAGAPAQTALTGSIGPSDVTLPVSTTSGWPNSAIGEFVIVVDPGLTNEEKILCSTYTSTSVNVVTRADGVSFYPAAADHVHGRETFATGATSASAPADTEADGSSIAPARADHRHARESIATLVTDLTPGLLGQPLGLTGATAATRYVGGTASGAPGSGTFATGDFVVDQAGNVWICTAGGSPGVWRVAGADVPNSRVFMAASPTWAAGSVKIPWDTASYDAGSMWDLVTNHRCTPNRAGLYAVTATATAQYNNNPQVFNLQIFLNGSAYSQGNQSTYHNQSAGDYETYAVTDDVRCNGTTDYLEIFTYNNGGNSVQSLGSGLFTRCAVRWVAP